MAEGARSVTSLPLHVQPVSDGGPGLIDALLAAGGGELHQVQVRGPLGDRVTARILVRGGSAIMESADACGLHLVPEGQRDPMRASTAGVGELLRAADALPVERIVVGLGGSATVDGGRGMAQALGAQPLEHPVTALADVRTHLGEAARVFGPQKGATPPQIEQLAAALEGQRARLDVDEFEGAGAAGGLAYGLRAYLGAAVLPGSAWVLRETGLDRRIAAGDVVITGEGRFDEQSVMGKITGALIELARQQNAAVLVVCGHAQMQDTHARVVDAGGSLLDEPAIRRLVTEHLPALV